MSKIQQIQKTLKIPAVAALTLVTSVTTLASGSEGGGETGESGTIFPNPVKYDSIGEVLLGILNGVIIILIPIMSLAIVWIGFKMVLAGRDKGEQYADLKKELFWALVGLFLVLGAGGILSVVQSTVDEVIADPQAREVMPGQTVG